MTANAQVLKQQVEVRRSQPADSRVALELYRQTLAQGWAVHFSTATAVVAQFPKGAFEAARHNAVTISPNLSLIEPEEGFLVSRADASPDLPFRGKPGKLTVIRRK